jgi:hypothetical protein
MPSPAERLAATPSGGSMGIQHTSPVRPFQRLDRANFADDAVTQYCGKQLGHLHRDAPLQRGQHSALYLVTDVLSRYQNVESSPQKQRACALDLRQIKQLIDFLSARLQEVSTTRLCVPFNYYPEAMYFLPDGELVNEPDDPNVDYHSEFEPLARLVYTARLNPAAAQVLLRSYTESCMGRSPLVSEQQSLKQANYLFDVLYYLYFIDVAFTTPGEGCERNIERDRALKNAAALIGRLRADQAALAIQENLPNLNLPKS